MCKQIIDSLSDALITCDQDQRVVVWNKRAEIMFGYRGEETLGQALQAIIPPAFRRKHRNGFARFVDNIRSRSSSVSEIMELQGCRRSGEIFPVELTYSLLKIRRIDARTVRPYHASRFEKQAGDHYHGGQEDGEFSQGCA